MLQVDKKLLLDHSMDDLTFVGEFVEVVEVAPPVEEEFLAYETEPGCELQVFSQSECSLMALTRLFEHVL